MYVYYIQLLSTVNVSNSLTDHKTDFYLNTFLTELTVLLLGIWLAPPLVCP